MDRATILEQLADRKISADEAARLLREQADPAEPASVPPSAAGRRLRVRVSNVETGRERVALALPMALVEAGLRLGARYDSQIADLNFSEILEAARNGAGGKLVDVENLENGERVEVFID